MTRTQRALSLALLGLTGCGSDPDAAVPLVSVRGVITHNGKPMANAMVSFVPDPANQAGTAGGDTTGPEGNYLARYRNRSGLAPGKYKVTVVAGPESDEAANANVSEAFKDDPFMAGEAVRAAAAARRKPKKPELKGEFDAEVTASGANLSFDVKSPTAAAVGKRSDARAM
jgi:hypothetical protein